MHKAIILILALYVTKVHVAESNIIPSSHYGTLGLRPNASETAIKRTYRKLILRYHPDKNPDDIEAHQKAKEVTEAYRFLSDPDLKNAYDTQLASKLMQSMDLQDHETAEEIRERLPTPPTFLSLLLEPLRSCLGL